MNLGALGQDYEDGEIIFQEGQPGNCMYVIQQGEVEIVKAVGRQEVCLVVRTEGEFFGEMAIFEREVRMATARARGYARVLSVDEKNFLRRIHEDPSLAYRVVQTLSRRVRVLSHEVARLRTLAEPPALAEPGAEDSGAAAR